MAALKSNNTQDDFLAEADSFNLCKKLLKAESKQTADNTVNTHFHSLIWFIGFLVEPHPSLSKAS